MSRVNKKMRGLLDAIEIDKAFLPDPLIKVLKEGFIKYEGCYLLAAFNNTLSNAAMSDFIDGTGYECFINSFHIDDYVDGNYLEAALLFVKECFCVWEMEKNQGALQAIISLDEFGGVIKLHLIRESERLLSDDIDSYEEAILEIDSSQAGHNKLTLLFSTRKA